MAELNYTTCDVLVTCKNPEVYKKLQDLYQENLEDCESSEIRGNSLSVCICNTIETDYMENHAVDFLNGIIRYAKEVDKEAEITGGVSWEDSLLNNGEIYIIIGEDGSYILSEPVLLDRETVAIVNAPTETLLEEIKSRVSSMESTERDAFLQDLVKQMSA